MKQKFLLHVSALFLLLFIGTNVASAQTGFPDMASENNYSQYTANAGFVTYTEALPLIVAEMNSINDYGTGDLAIINGYKKLFLNNLYHAVKSAQNVEVGLNNSVPALEAYRIESLQQDITWNTVAFFQDVVDLLD